MKRQYLFFLLAAVMVMSGCDKLFLKKSTVRIDARRAEIIVDLPNDEGKYLEYVSDEELLEQYVEEVKNRMDRNKITVVEENADYVLTIEEVHMVEMVTNEMADGEYFDLSEISIRTKMNLIKSEEDLPTYLTSEDEVSEYVTESKDKKGKDKDGAPYVSGFGGRDGAFESAAREIRRTTKKAIKKKQ